MIAGGASRVQTVGCFAAVTFVFACFTDAQHGAAPAPRGVVTHTPNYTTSLARL